MSYSDWEPVIDILFALPLSKESCELYKIYHYKVLSGDSCLPFKLSDFQKLSDGYVFNLTINFILITGNQE